MTHDDFIAFVNQHPPAAVVLAAVTYARPAVTPFWSYDMPPVRALKVAVDWVFDRATMSDCDEIAATVDAEAHELFEVSGDEVREAVYGAHAAAFVATVPYDPTTAVDVVTAVTGRFHPPPDQHNAMMLWDRRNLANMLGTPGRWGKPVQLRTGRWWMGDYLYEAEWQVDGVPLSWTRVPATEADLVAMDEAMEAGLV